jgi:hypothetical protein
VGILFIGSSNVRNATLEQKYFQIKKLYQGGKINENMGI